jgi:hypothetical protein
LAGDSEARQLAGFRENWVEPVRNIYAELKGTEVILFTRPDGTVI